MRRTTHTSRPWSRRAALLLVCLLATGSPCAGALEADLGPQLLEARRLWAKGDALGAEASKVARSEGDPIPLLDQQEAAYNAAEAAYTEALKAEPEHPHALADYGRLLIARRKFRKARRQLEAALESPRAAKAFAAAEQADVLRTLGGLLERSGQTGRALAAYRKALELNGADPRNRVSLAVAQCAWEEPEPALEVLKPLTGPELALDGAPPALRALAFYTLAYALEESQRSDEALAAYRRAAQLAEEAGSTETCGVAEQARLAIRRLGRAAREVQPEEARQRRQRALLRCQEGRRLKEEAIKDRAAFATAREKLFSARGPQEQAAWRAKEPLQSLLAAIRAFQEALRIYPKCLRAHRELGLCYLALFEREAALPYLEAAAAYDPASPCVLALLGETRLWVGRETQALETFTALLRAEPEYAPAHLGVAQATLCLLRALKDKYLDPVRLRALKDKYLDLARDALDRALVLGADAGQLKELFEQADKLDEDFRSGKRPASPAHAKPSEKPSRSDQEPFDLLKGTILE